MGVTAETTNRLRWHAGLITGLEGTSVDELLFERDLAEGEFEAAMADLLRTLQTLSVELSGQRPSASVGELDSVPRSIAYAISEITNRLRRRNRSDEAWVVDTAWNAVLAGDIDDIADHTRDEARARAS